MHWNKQKKNIGFFYAGSRLHTGERVFFFFFFFFVVVLNHNGQCDADDLRDYDADEDANRLTGKCYQENEWQKVNRRKRKRFNTGTADLSHFQSLSGDDKLAIFFGKLIDIEEKMPSFRELQNTVDTVRQKTNTAEISIRIHEQQIKTLNYKSVDWRLDPHERI